MLADEDEDALFSLYPTLFRWNIASAVDKLGTALLYIPHCSDGTPIATVSPAGRSPFISHIVQMEPQ
jgi:hypothetical protein